MEYYLKAARYLIKLKGTLLRKDLIQQIKENKKKRFNQLYQEKMVTIRFFSIMMIKVLNFNNLVVNLEFPILITLNK